MRGSLWLGTAGWSLPREVQHAFAAEGSHLERYARRLPACEINSSFHRPHRESVWRRWAASVPAGFRFSAKLPKTITHERRLVDTAPLVDEFLAQASPLGETLACLLVQLPPSLAFNAAAVDDFLAGLRSRWARDVALEPRHASWFTTEADALLAGHRVARVLADPVRFEAAAAPGGWPDLVYLRLHGSPRTYYSAYEQPLLEALGRRIAVELEAGRDVWCIFDNTAAGAATANALELESALRSLHPE